MLEDTGVVKTGEICDKEHLDNRSKTTIIT